MNYLPWEGGVVLEGCRGVTVLRRHRNNLMHYSFKWAEQAWHPHTRTEAALQGRHRRFPKCGPALHFTLFQLFRPWNCPSVITFRVWMGSTVTVVHAHTDTQTTWRALPSSSFPQDCFSGCVHVNSCEATWDKQTAIHSKVAISWHGSCGVWPTDRHYR